MIHFACPTCGREFHVDPALADRRARCKRCGHEITIPRHSTHLAPGNQADARPAAPSPRLRRLMADHKVLVEVLATVDHIRLVSTEGDPPHRYILDYHIKGLEPGTGNQPRERTSHRMQVDLPADYPRLAPHCRMLTPVFHPNIDDSSVCVGDHWTAGERLIDLVVRVGEMLAYQAYNIKSPLNGVAAMWADLNRQNLPTDARDLRPDRL